MTELKEILFENADIKFRNFAGAEGAFNNEGDRNFCIFLTPDQADEMDKAGWNVRQLKVREPGDIPQDYIQVSLKYRGRPGTNVRPPTVVQISSRGRSFLAEEDLEILDWVEIKSVDLVVRPYSWAFSGKSGVKAYLKSLYVTIHEDYLSLKYADIPEIGAGESLPALESGEKHDDIWDAEVVSEYDTTDQLAIGR